MNNLYIDVNVLQSVPSSNINRDDTGAPKTAIYGGVTRSRVSSQSWKRAMRMAFAQQSAGADWIEGIRTMRVPLLLANEIQKQSNDLSEEDALKKSLDVFGKAKIKLDKKTNHTKALLMVSKGQIKQLAKYATTNDNLDGKAIKKLLQDDHSLDMALFGRMVADDPSLNVDASAQVAHAISTHEIVPEFDYYTAVDDEKQNDESGSAMIGTIEYDSATLYRYANVNVNELINNLGNIDVALKGLQLFVRDFIMTMPTGKQNSFANKTVPQYVMVTIRADTPVNLVSAFEEPIKSRNGYLQPSVKKLEEEYTKTQQFVQKPLSTFVVTNAESHLDQVNNLDDLISGISKTLETRVKDEDSNN